MKKINQNRNVKVFVRDARKNWLSEIKDLNRMSMHGLWRIWQTISYHRESALKLINFLYSIVNSIDTEWTLISKLEFPSIQTSVKVLIRFLSLLLPLSLSMTIPKIKNLFWIRNKKKRNIRRSIGQFAYENGHWSARK